jgi:uncharacterized protein (DUF433 family)
MSEFTPAVTNYITFNRHGTPVLADTNLNIVPIGLAHESGISERELLDRYGISRGQLHAALAYFYDHRDEISEYLAESERLLEENSTDIRDALEELRKRQ